MTTTNDTPVWMCVLAAIDQLGLAVVPALPLHAKSFGVSASAIGMAVGIYGLARFAGAIPASWLSDKAGRRHALALGGIVSTAGNLWCALAAGYPEFILARFVAGAGAGLIVTTGQIVLADVIMLSRQRGFVLACIVSLASAAARTDGLFNAVPCWAACGWGFRSRKSVSHLPSGRWLGW